MRRIGPDPLLLSMQWAKLQSVVDEASATLLRTAFSRIVTEANDYTCALFDVKGDMIIQSSQGLTSFTGVLAVAIKHFLKAFPIPDLDPGDCLIMNEPWLGASQVNDMHVVTPIFHHQRVVAYAANISHCPDVGGRILSGDSREVFEEGIRLPMSKLFKRGKPNEELLRIFLNNVRVPDIVRGDLMAQWSSNLIMERGVLAFLREYRLDSLERIAHEILRRSEAAMRTAIRAVPDGTYTSEIETDGFDEPLQIRASVEVRGDRISVDYAGTSPQTPVGINCCWNYTYAETVFPLICVVRPATPVNGGCLRPLTVVAPEGSVLNPRFPAAVGARAMVSMFLPTAIFRALASAVPDRVLADPSAPTWIPTCSGLNQYGKRFADIIFMNGGLGARPTKDGINVIGFPANISSTPIEIFENEKPIMVGEKQLVPDTGGPGKYRGGCGQRFSLTSYSEAPITFAMRGDRVQHPAQGLFGGGAGAPGSVTLNGSPIHSKRTIQLHAGDHLVLETPGGGGYGDPAERSKTAQDDDLGNGYVTRTGADLG
jgi:N-methylhydantoinase B